MTYTKVHYNRIILYIVVILLIFSSRDTMISYHNSIVMLISLVSLFLFLLLSGFLREGRVHRKSCIICIVMSSIVMLSMIINKDYAGYSIIVSLIVAVFFVYCYSFEEFYDTYSKVVFLICCLSLLHAAVFFLLNVNIMGELFTIITGKNEVPWGFRICGIFREPAMFIIYIGLALVREMLLKKANLLFVFVYTITIFFTASITGYIATGFLLLFALLKAKGKMVHKVVSISCIIIGIILSGTWKYFWRRLSTVGASGESSISRYYSVLFGAKIGINNPLLGAGATKSQLLFDEMSKALLGKTVCWANMLTFLWASFGLIFLLVFCLGIFFIAKDRMERICFFLFIALVFCGETMTYSSVPYIMMLYGYSEHMLRKTTYSRPLSELMMIDNNISKGISER